jgi:hypothetical protein
MRPAASAIPGRIGAEPTLTENTLRPIEYFYGGGSFM